MFFDDLPKSSMKIMGTFQLATFDYRRVLEKDYLDDVT